eukprot:scaffold158_cov141-Amphora_coffeaeformis.AAC.7
MESADDNSTYSGHSETFLTPTLRRRPLPSDVQVGQAKSSRKKAKQSEKCEPVYTHLPTNTKSISSLLTNLKRKLKSKPYDKIPSNHIAHCRYVCDRCAKFGRRFGRSSQQRCARLGVCNRGAHVSEKISNDTNILLTDER